MHVKAHITNLETVLHLATKRIIACSGGIDSLLLATIAFRNSPEDTIIAHAVSPAVPEAAAQRVREFSAREGWDTQYVSAGEFDDPAYLANPINRCYYCKDHLYSTLTQLRQHFFDNDKQNVILMSGANLDDLKEYRPGLEAAKKHGVRHPYIEAEVDKAAIRNICKQLDLPIAELPASPCLASRLYTGTQVTEERVRAIDLAETTIKSTANINVVRCRIRNNEMLIEVMDSDRVKINPSIVESAKRAAHSFDQNIETAMLDPQSYSAGRAFQEPE